MDFFLDDRGRIPLSVIGIVMILLSTAILLFLIGAEHGNIITSAGQERERGLADVMSLSSGDMGTALNYAGMYAMSTVGENPVVNASSGYEIDNTGNHTADEVNLDRIRKLTLDRFTMYMQNNYDGSFYYGDYNVTVMPTNDPSLIDIYQGNMTLARHPMAKHPLMPHDNYTVYYAISIPTNVTIQKRGSDFNYSYGHNVSTMVTSRYPLLEGLTDEYEERMNGSSPLDTTPFFMDITAGSFAFTWAGGYTQYAYGEPLNIVSTNNTELLVNGANLVEQGAVYNSVDPVSAADIVLAMFGKDEDVQQRNDYNMTNMSANSTRINTSNNKTAEPPKEYNFTIKNMLDNAYNNLTLGAQVDGVTCQNYVDTVTKGAYTCKMHIKVVRSPKTVNFTDAGIETGHSAPRWADPRYDGINWTRGEEAYDVYVNDSSGQWAQTVTIEYIADDYAAVTLGKDTEKDIRSPLLWDTHKDIHEPYEPYQYKYSFKAGIYYARHDISEEDPNAMYIVNNYRAGFDYLTYVGDDKKIPFAERLDKILFDMKISGDNWLKNTFVSGEQGVNRPPDWVAVESDKELKDLMAEINRSVHVTLKAEDYRDKPWTMTGNAYSQMQAQFNGGYKVWQARWHYEAVNGTGDYTGSYNSSGSKALYYIRRAFLEDVKAQLAYAAAHAGNDIEKTIDQQMKDNKINMNSSDLGRNAGASNNYLNPSSLDTSLNIPFGLNMTLQSHREFDNDISYGWEENVTLIVDQKPAYLPMAYYKNDNIGYKGYPVKTKNVCLFSLPTDFIDTDRISDAITAPVMDGISAMEENILELNNKTVEAEVNALADNVSAVSKEEITGQIRAIASTDPELKNDGEVSILTADDVEGAVDEAYDKRDNATVVRDLRNGTLQQEIAEKLAAKVRASVESEAIKRSNESIDYIVQRTKNKVIGVEEKAVATTVHKLGSNIKNAFNSFTREALKKAESAAMKKALGRIPGGLPLLPPWGWWATLNVWYIDVYGDIPYLAIYDTDTSIPNPVFGHEAQFYTRYKATVKDPNTGEVLGQNMPVHFQTSTCTFIVVPPGEQGVGDKIGGWEEKSKGYDK